MDQDLSFFRKQKRKQRIIRIVLGTVLVAVFFAALWFVLDRFVFKVKKITVSPSELYTEEELIAACEIEDGTRLFGVDRKAVKRAVEENFPFLTNVEVRLRLPDTISVVFDEKMGEIALTIGKDTFAVDADLMVLARIGEEGPGTRLGLTADGVSRCIVGEQIEFFDDSIPLILSDIVLALDRASLLGTVRALNLSDKFDLRMDYGNRFEIKLGEDEDLDLKLAMVKRVISELLAEDAGEIDISDPNNAYVRLYNRG